MWSPGPVVVAGPCVLEHDGLNLQVGDTLADIARRLGVRIIYKASYLKANRSRRDAPRGPGLEAGLRMLETVRRETGLPVLTDVHTAAEVPVVSEVADALQVPAFLCRQTDLLEAVGSVGLPVNIKKGQWMAPGAMAGAVEKVVASGATVVAVTERGTFFGYNDLVVDMRNFTRLREATGACVLFDATHAVQQPGMGPGGATGGSRPLVPTLLNAAAAAGADGFFLETHPTPQSAPSDAASMWPLAEFEPLIDRALAVWASGQGRTQRA